MQVKWQKKDKHMYVAFKIT